jgi:prepilin-type N-terminal cleavage/methylation domain-containing protein
MKRAFTLIELLVVIGILAVLMAGVVALIDPVDKNRQANDAVVQSLVANAATAEEAYAAQHNGCYSPSWLALFNAGELKLNPPNMPAGYAAITFTGASATCTAPEIDSVIICATLRSKKYTGITAWKYSSSNGRTCSAAACAGACP